MPACNKVEEEHRLSDDRVVEGKEEVRGGIIMLVYTSTNQRLPVAIRFEELLVGNAADINRAPVEAKSKHLQDGVQDGV